jgi:16S rRNA (uracil1498-N3)-methyltransferase
VNLLLLEPAEIDARGQAVLGDVRAKHVRDVLRVGIGATLRAGVIGGGAGDVTVIGADRDGVILDCSALRTAPVPARSRVDLLLALPRPKALRRLYASLACLGVGRILLSNAARVERYYFDSHVLEDGCARRQFQKGLSQAGDTILPELLLFRSFRKLVEDELAPLAPGSLRLLADLGAPATGRESAREAALGASPEQRVLVAIGPEGGWVDFERACFREAGFVTVTLGTRILSVDLACALAVGAVHEALRESAVSGVTR